MVDSRAQTRNARPSLTRIELDPGARLSGRSRLFGADAVLFGFIQNAQKLLPRPWRPRSTLSAHRHCRHTLCVH